MNHVQIVLPVDEIFIYYEGILNDQLNFVGNNPSSHDSCPGVHWLEGDLA